MPQKINLNSTPYNDDFNASKGYYKVLFRPGYSIQSRELTTLQSVLQNQLENFGKSQYKQGQQVVPGEVSFNNKLNYVKLSSVSEVAVNVNGNVVFQKYDIGNLVGTILSGLSSGITATVVSYAYGSEIESDLLFVKYTNSGNSNEEINFRQGETLEVLDIADSPLLVVGTDGSVLPATIDIIDYDTKKTTTVDSPAMGYASAVQVEEGVYYVNGYFVNNTKQLIVVDKYYSNPSVKVGFEVKEQIITPEEDKTLYDNARGFSNFSAPGAHRLKIDLVLNVYEYDATTSSEFIQLVTIKNGGVQKLVKSESYNLIEETLARRTYDESGDYVVDDFSMDLREYYLRNDNRGTYALDPETNLVQGIEEDAASGLMVAGIGPGKAYVKGYEILKKDITYQVVDKARDTFKKEDNKIKVSSLSGFNISNAYNSIPLNAEGEDLNGYPDIYLNSVFNDGKIGFNNVATKFNRRGLKFTTDQGVRTIYLKLGGDNPTFPSDSILGTKLWFIIQKGNSAATVAVESIDILAYNIVTRPEIGTDVNLNYVEYTVIGNKSYLNLLTDYDEDNGSKIRFVFSTKTLATDFYYASSQPAPYGQIVDYNETITPIIGISKPKNFTLVEKGSGFNPDTDIVLSKGRGSGPASVQRVIINFGGTGYTSVPTVTLSAPSSGVTATATAIINNGIITSVKITNAGSGYTTAPVVSVSGGNGTGAILTSVLDPGPYNAIFNLSYFNPIFFTKIIVDKDLDSTSFLLGKYIIGLSSGAYGVVEGVSGGFYSTGNTLFLRTLSGEFKSGETILDEEGNSRRIARENTISHFVVYNKGTGYTTTTSAGSSIISKVLVNGVGYESAAIQINLIGSSIYKLDVADRDLVSSTYNSTPSVTATVGTGASIFPVLYKNTVVTYGPTNVKSMFSQFGANDKYIFTADVESFNTSYLSNKTLTDFTFSGTKGYKFIECNGFSGDPSPDLVQGDIVQFVYSDNSVVRSTVQYVTKPEGLLKSRIYLDSALQKNVVNSNIVRLRAKVENSTSSSLIIPTGAKYVNSISSTPENSKISYYLRRDFITKITSSGGDITFAAQLPYGTQRFIAFSENNFLITILDPDKESNPNTSVNKGDILYLTTNQVTITNSSDNSTGLTAGSVTINLPSNFFGTINNFDNFKIKLTATIEVNKAKPRLKTSYENKRIVVFSPGDRVIPFRGVDYDTNASEVLSYSDVYKFKYVYEGTVSVAPVADSNGNLLSGSDITDRFTFDDGQRDTFYDVARLVLKPGYDAPTGQLLIGFDYFEHSQGDFCTIDSYLHEAGISEDEVPNFNSTVYGRVSLKDVIDFRAKVDSTCTIGGYQDTSILSSPPSFTRAGGITAGTIASDTNIEYSISFDLEQYLDRIDGLFLNKNGDFIIKKGNPSLNPTKPTDLDNAIPIYYYYLPAFTASANDVNIIPVDNKRYTMRDIGKLEKRVERLEKYTLLSMLEQQALNMQVKNEIGLDRFKNGFIVDNFESHNIGNLISPDYKCAVDTQQSVLRPRSFESSLKLKEINTRKEERELNGYTISNGVVTLPYDNIPYFGSSFATKTININPFVVVQYVGGIQLDPPVDQWYNQKQFPAILNNDSKVFSVFYAKDSTREGLASIYGNYSINWVGTNRTFFNTSPLNDINFSSSSSIVSASVASSSNVSPQNNELAQGVSSTNIGGNNIISNIKFFCETRLVKFVLTGMKPRTKLFGFIDGKFINKWIAQDFRFTGVAGNSISTFESGITTDENGNASGVILIPAGLPPVSGSSVPSDIKNIAYDSEGDALYFITGSKTIKFTSSIDGNTDSDVDTFTSIVYHVAGSLPANPSSITSTIPAIQKSDEGIQLIDGAKIKPNPLSQSFKIENSPGGIFLTGINLYFAKKSSTIPVRVYLSNTESGKPGKYIIPGTEKSLLPDTYLRVFTNGSLKINRGELATGANSRASGPIKTVLDKNKIELIPSITGEFTLSNDQIYTIVLSNNNGKVFVEEDLLFDSLSLFNAKNTTVSTALKVTIAKDSGRLTGLEVFNVGSGYESATLTVESPQLVGGITAAAGVYVSNGNVYDAEVTISGSEYTSAPSIIINGTGTSPAAAAIKSFITIDTPAVRMGVAIDTDTEQSTIPTFFKFDYPVYLQNDAEYAFAVESDSTDYEIWSSKLGENEKVTNAAVTTQPLIGSVFKSQNADTWTEDLFEDIKFILFRAEFDNSRTGVLNLKNEALGYEVLDANPFQADSSSDGTATSNLFRNNNKIVKVNHLNNGFEDSGNSYVSFKSINNFGGIAAELVVDKLFTVINSGLEFYNINTNIRATSNELGGGTTVLTSYNRKFEKLYAQVGILSLPSTRVEAFVKTTNIVPVDSTSTVYSSYSQSPFEKTFLNQEHIFNNQKVVASRINELKNPNVVGESLLYKLELASDKTYLSPVVDLRTSSIKLVHNQVEKSSGKESRFGRKDQIIKLYPVYKVIYSGTGLGPISESNIAGSTTNIKTVTGYSSKAKGIVVKVEKSTTTLYLKMLTDTIFEANETLLFDDISGLDQFPTNIFSTPNGITEVPFTFEKNSTITAFDKSDLTKQYTNVISGKVVLWDDRKKELRIANNKNPINNNESALATTSPYARVSFIGNTSAQVPDVFRVGDLLSYDNLASSERSFAEIKSITYSTGAIYVPEIASKNSSSIAKYVTKEISLENPSTCIDVRLTANIFEQDDIKVFYKYKLASSQYNFDDLDWNYFNEDGNPDVVVTPSSDNVVSGYLESQSSYKEYKFSVRDLSDYSSFAIKIILRSSQPVFVPKIQDVRIVASF